MNPNYSLIILRGLPGSGKTTLAHILSENEKYPIFSIDDYFINKETNEYIFDFKNNHLAYKNCEEQTDFAMKNKVEKIFLHNTFTMDWEIEPYFKLAAINNYALYIVTVEHHHNGENVHQITEIQLQKMAEKYKIKLF